MSDKTFRMLHVFHMDTENIETIKKLLIICNQMLTSKFRFLLFFAVTKVASQADGFKSVAITVANGKHELKRLNTNKTI